MSQPKLAFGFSRLNLVYHVLVPMPLYWVSYSIVPRPPLGPCWPWVEKAKWKAASLSVCGSTRGWNQLGTDSPAVRSLWCVVKRNKAVYTMWCEIGMPSKVLCVQALLWQQVVAGCYGLFVVTASSSTMPSLGYWFGQRMRSLCTQQVIDTPSVWELSLVILWLFLYTPVSNARTKTSPFEWSWNFRSAMVVVAIS